MKFWQIKNIAENKGELLLYGDISESSWWGDEITPKQFAEDLKNLGSVSEIDVRINSMGGDVFAANTISSLLRANGAKVNIYIDGIAASAATIVAMAGDTIYIPEHAMMMIHDPLVGLMGYYNSKDFEEFIEVLEKIKDSIAISYVAQTNKSKEEINEIMSNETWYTGTEAVENGFADELITLDLDLEIENKGNSKLMIVNKLPFDVTNYKNVPQNIVNKVNNSPQNIKRQPINNKKILNNTDKGEKIVNIEDLKNKYPYIYDEVKNIGYEEGCTDERQRIKNIEEIAPKGYENLVNKAKFENAITAEALAVNIIKAQKDLGKKYINDAKEDAEELKDVEPYEEEDKKEKKEEEAVNRLTNSFKNRRRR